MGPRPAVNEHYRSDKIYPSMKGSGPLLACTFGAIPAPSLGQPQDSLPMAPVRTPDFVNGSWLIVHAPQAR